MALPSAGRRRPLQRLLIALLLLSAGCRDDGPARIIYPNPWTGILYVSLVREAIQPLAGHERVEFPDSVLRRIGTGSGYAGELEFATAALKLPAVAAAVGAQSSRSTLLVAPLYAAHGIPLIVPTSTSTRLQRLGPWVFQLPPNDQAEGEFMVAYAVDQLGARRVTIYYLVSDEYGVGLRDGIVAGLRRRGLTPADQVGVISETDFARRVAQSLARARPDAVIIAARTSEAFAITQALVAQHAAVPAIWGDGAVLEAVDPGSMAGVMDRVYGVAWWHPDQPDSLSRAFVAKFSKTVKRLPGPSDAMYHDAIMLAARAVIEADGRPEEVRRYLAALGTERPAHRGVTGKISFGSNRVVNLIMTRIEGGRVVLAGRKASQ